MRGRTSWLAGPLTGRLADWLELGGGRGRIAGGQVILQSVYHCGCVTVMEKKPMLE